MRSEKREQAKSAEWPGGVRGSIFWRTGSPGRGRAPARAKLRRFQGETTTTHGRIYFPES